jgi:hypothetical protein
MEVFGMIQIAGSQLCQWDVGRSVNISDSKATHVHFANQGDSKAVIIEITNGTAKIPDYLLQTGKALNAYAVLDGVTLESRSFAVCKRERPENYVYEDDRRNYIYELITSAEAAVENANQAAQNANEAAEKLGSIVIPTKVSQLENDSGFLTEVPVTTTKVELTKQTDGSYLSDLSSTEIMAAYRDHKTVHCYHNKMILPLIRSVVNDAVFSGIYDGQIHTVNVASNRVATVTVIPLSSGGGSGEPGKDGADGITPHIGANGNWWIGEEDTGVSAGVTDEQISGAVEEYMEDNPLVKTVNGTAPDENGNVELDIQPGGGGVSSSGGVFRITMVLTEDVSNVVLKMPVKWGKIVQFNLNCIPKLSGESSVEMYTGAYKKIVDLSSNTKAINVYGIQYYTDQWQDPVYTGGIAVADNYEEDARPTVSGHRWVAGPNRDEISIYTTVDGVVFQAGARFEMWGVYTP